MKISVIGCGRWGSFIAHYLQNIGHGVTLYGRENSSNMKSLKTKGSLKSLVINKDVKLTSDLGETVVAEIIVISINAQNIRSLFERLKKEKLKNKTFVLCMKGIEVGSGLRLTQIVEEYVHSSCDIAVWLGPGHVEQFLSGVPNCMVIDGENREKVKELVHIFSSDLIRFYFGDDLIGNEIGAAAKNVIGIAAGMLDGYNLSSLKGALMARGTREVSRLIKAYGGKELSAYGLCHLGDYEATVFSKYSHNRMFGEKFVKEEEYTELAEGYYTVKAMVKMAGYKGVCLPICKSVYRIIYENGNPAVELKELLQRDIKAEFS